MLETNSLPQISANSSTPNFLLLASFLFSDPLTQSGLSRAIVTELKHIMKRHRPLILATKCAIGAPNRWRPYGSGSATASGRAPLEGARGSDEDDDVELPQKAVLYHKEYMPAVWQVRSKPGTRATCERAWRGVVHWVRGRIG